MHILNVLLELMWIIVFAEFGSMVKPTTETVGFFRFEVRQTYFSDKKPFIYISYRNLKTCAFSQIFVFYRNEARKNQTPSKPGNGDLEELRSIVDENIKTFLEIAAAQDEFCVYFPL